MSEIRLAVMLSAAMFIGVGLFVILLVRASRHFGRIGEQHAALAPLLRERERSCYPGAQQAPLTKTFSMTSGA